MAKYFGGFIASKRRAVFQRMEEWQGMMYSGIVFGATLVVMFWASVFLYTSFYFTYMPQESVNWPIHFNYKSCGDKPGLCSNPHAIVSVTDPIRGSILARGQKYRVVVDMEMPESPTNQRLGMFLVEMAMKSHNGDTLRQSARSTMLRYKSPLLQTLSTTIFAPLLLYGMNEEKQMVTVELFSQYEEDPVTPLSDVHISLLSRHIELYAAQLRIHAMFTGLRYFMYHYPLSAAGVGIGICMVFLSAVVILSWYQFSGTNAITQVRPVSGSFANGQVMKGSSDDLKTSNLLMPESASSRRSSATSRKSSLSSRRKSSLSRRNSISGSKVHEITSPEGTDKELIGDDSSTDTFKVDSDKNQDNNQLPEAERRDSDEFEVVGPTKIDSTEVDKPEEPPSPDNEESGVLRRRVQSIPSSGETLLDE